MLCWLGWLWLVHRHAGAVGVWVLLQHLLGLSLASVGLCWLWWLHFPVHGQAGRLLLCCVGWLGLLHRHAGAGVGWVVTEWLPCLWVHGWVSHWAAGWVLNLLVTGVWLCWVGLLHRHAGAVVGWVVVQHLPGLWVRGWVCG